MNEYRLPEEPAGPVWDQHGKRPDLLFPVGRIKKGGQVIGCRRLGRFSDAPLHTL